MKTIRYAIEAFFLYILFFAFKLLPPMTASNIGGWIGRTIGPKLSASRKARRHIHQSLPDKNQDEIETILTGMWENLGRVIAEYPHLSNIGKNYTIAKGEEHLKNVINSNKPAIFFGGHIGNWEVNSAATLEQYNFPVDLTFRAPNNKWTGTLLNKARTLNGRLKAHPKSIESGRALLKALRENKTLGILIDQKYNQGVETQFFNQPAMTNPIAAQLCQKFKCPLIPIRSIRENGCNFSLNIYPEIPTTDKNGNDRPIIDVLNDANTLLEGWIKEKPEQWIWLHRRWKN